MTKEEIKAREEELKLQKKEIKLQKKSARRKKRDEKPGPFKRSYLQMKSKALIVRDMYKEMNRQIKTGEIENHEAEELPYNEAEVQVDRLRHAKGKFVVTAHPGSDDYFWFLFLHEISTPAGLGAAILNVVAVILLIISLINSSQSSIILLAVVLLTLILVGPLSTLIRARRLAGLVKGKGHTKTYCFSAAGFDINDSETGYTACEWSSIDRIREAKNNFFFYMNGDEGFVIPKADITAGGRKTEQFAKLLKEQVGNLYKGSKK